jgi:hypothetical protein
MARPEHSQAYRNADHTSLVSSFDVALVYADIGQKNEAIALLEKAADEHVGWITCIAVDPALDNLRGDPRFQAVVERVGIPPMKRAQ